MSPGEENLYPRTWESLEVVLSHDWLTGMRGGERVLEILCRAFPRAPIFTMLHDPGAVSGTINRHPVHTSLLQQVPGARRHYRMFLPVMPYLVERFRPPEADILISTSHCVAKGIRPPPGMRHLCYCFTPMRYVWVFYEEYFGKSRLKQGLLSPLLGRLREWDRRSSRRVDRFVAISRNVQRRIESCYQRPADVVYPPVDLEWFTPGPGTGGEYDLIVSALVPYKRIDLAVRAYSRTGYPLVIVGTGTEYERLRRMAAENITFLGRQPDEAVRELYRGCRCLVFPGEEDFGLVPVEAQACGRPVVAYAAGGVLESVEEGVGGVFFDEQREDALISAVEECARRSWDGEKIRASVLRFSLRSFLEGLDRSIRRCLAGEE